MSVSTTTAVLVAVLAGGAVGAVTVNLIVTHEDPPHQIVQPAPIDESRLADIVAARIIEADNAREAAERARRNAEAAKHKKSDCAFWGNRGMEGCS